MTDATAGPMSTEETRMREAADRAYRLSEGETLPPTTTRDRWLDAIKEATRGAPLQALAIAFILGAMFARRRR